MHSRVCVGGKFIFPQTILFQLSLSFYRNFQLYAVNSRSFAFPSCLGEKNKKKIKDFYVPNLVHLKTFSLCKKRVFIKSERAFRRFVNNSLNSCDSLMKHQFSNPRESEKERKGEKLFTAATWKNVSRDRRKKFMALKWKRRRKWSIIIMISEEGENYYV
jgi:hypothetical protein